MPFLRSPARLSPRRAELASFEHAYRLGTVVAEQSHVDQFVIATGDPFQPYRLVEHQIANDDAVIACVA